MSAITEVGSRAQSVRRRFVLVGGADDGMDHLASDLTSRGLGTAAVIGVGGDRPSDDPRHSQIAVKLRDRWPERVRDGIHALDLAAEPLMFGAGLLLAGEADVLLASPAVPVSSLEDAYRWILGPDRGVRGRGAVRYLHTADDRLLTTVTPDTAGPLDARGVAAVALAAANHRQQAVGDQARIALLVPPPSQDASHSDAELVLSEFQALAPGIPAAVEWMWSAVDGARNSARFRTRPNVLIFPDPVSGHLAHGLLRDATSTRIWGPLFPDERWAVAGLDEGALPEDHAAVATVASAGIRAV